jgi:hypothetical protein
MRVEYNFELEHCEVPCFSVETKKIEAYKKILTSAPHAPKLSFTEGESGSLGSYHYCWISIHANDDHAAG